MGIKEVFKDLEVNRVSPDVAEDLRHFQFGNKVKYSIFWGSLALASVISYNQVISNLDSVGAKALLKNGTSPLIAVFETDYTKLSKDVIKKYEEDSQNLYKKELEFKKINGNVALDDLPTFTKKMDDSKIKNIVANSSDIHEFMKYLLYSEIIKSNESITINDNEYKIIEIINKLASLDDETKAKAVEEPVKKIVEKNILRANEDEIKSALLFLSKNQVNVRNLAFKDKDDLINKIVEEVKKGYFELPISYMSSLRLPLIDVKKEIEKEYQIFLDSENAKNIEAKKGVDTLKSEIEALKKSQESRNKFLIEFKNVNEKNYLDKRDNLKELSKDL